VRHLRLLVNLRRPHVHVGVHQAQTSQMSQPEGTSNGWLALVARVVVLALAVALVAFIRSNRTRTAR
jgi:hypothetical protein